MQSLLAKYGKSVLFPGILIVATILFFLLSKDEPSPSSLVTTISNEPNKAIENVNAQEPAKEPEPIVQTVVVDVKGAVKYPGVYTLTTEDRIMDAIEAAGGYVEGANTQLINHAQRVADEMVIYVPKQGEIVDNMVAPQLVQSSHATSGQDSSKVNINTAAEDELTTLPGIGPAKAKAIVAHRQENGPFQTIEELKNVSGIGDKTFEQLRDAISVK